MHRASLVGSAVLAVIAAPATATVLTFEIGATGQGTTLPDAYGDNVTADGVPAANYDYDEGNGWTPNVTVEYRTLDTSQNLVEARLALNNDYSSGSYVAWPITPAGRAEITFVPEPGYAVRINSFLLATYLSSPAYAVDLIRITDASRSMNLWTPASFDGTPAPNQQFNPNYTGAIGETLRLQFGHNWNVAFEDVNFDQVVPEPTAVASMALAGGTMTLRHRRRRA